MKKLLSALLFGSISVADAAAQSQQTERAEEAERGRCIPTSDIASYKVESDLLVRLKMRNASDVIMRLRRHCPQLHFHDYISYTPVNGQLCEGVDDVVSRSGMPCRIASFTEAAAPSAPVSQNTDNDSQ